MKGAVCRSSLALLGALATTAALEATTALRLSDAAMVAEAELIVTGECADVESRWIGKELVTIATVTVAQTLKGEDEASVSVVLPGGVDVNRRFPIASTWPGAPTIRPGEEVFLFLEGDQALDGGQTIVGFSQGKFAIETDAQGRRRVARDLQGVGLLQSGLVTPGDQRSAPLAEFESTIRRLVEAERTGARVQR